MTAENSAALNLQGKSLKTLAGIRREMFYINHRQDDQQASEFMTTLRKRLGQRAEDTVFYLSGFSETVGEMADMLTRFLQRDCHGDFHITEAPQNEYGNTARGTYIARVRLVEGYQGRPYLSVLEPKEIAEEWPTTLSPLAWKYRVVDGPARMITRNEWVELVGLKDLLV